MYILFIMIKVVAGVVVLGIGFGILLWGISLLLNSFNCGDVSFCLEEKSGIILMTLGGLTASVATNLLFRSK